MFWRRFIKPIDFLVVGVGNPGPEYAHTRHNVGFRVLNALAKRWKVTRDEMRFRGLFAIAQVDRQRIGLLKPLTYVNLIGQSVGEAVKKLTLPLDRLLIVLDDVSLTLGKLRLRSKGSDGGHKGLQSVLQVLGTEEVPRLRIGVGIPIKGVDLAEFVLSPFAPEEEPVISEVIERACDAVQTWIAEGIETAMTKFNR